jgi:predicted membrane protein
MPVLHRHFGLIRGLLALERRIDLDGLIAAVKLAHMAFFSCRRFTGHTSTHVPQPTHFSSSIRISIWTMSSAVIFGIAVSPLYAVILEPCSPRVEMPHRL